MKQIYRNRTRRNTFILANAGTDEQPCIMTIKLPTETELQTNWMKVVNPIDVDGCQIISTVNLSVQRTDDHDPFMVMEEIARNYSALVREENRSDLPLYYMDHGIDVSGFGGAHA